MCLNWAKMCRNHVKRFPYYQCCLNIRLGCCLAPYWSTLHTRCFLVSFFRKLPTCTAPASSLQHGPPCFIMNINVLHLMIRLLSTASPLCPLTVLLLVPLSHPGTEDPVLIFLPSLCYETACYWAITETGSKGLLGSELAFCLAVGESLDCLLHHPHLESQDIAANQSRNFHSN